MNKELWCINVIGPDDLHAAPSREQAEYIASRLNYQWTASHPNDDLGISFQVIPWPHSAESHARDLKSWPDMVAATTLRIPSAGA